jgi:hypothetical protein
MKFPCVLKNILFAIRESSGLSFAIKRVGLPCCAYFYYCYLLLVTNYLAIKLCVTDNFSACRHYLAVNRLSFPSAPHWVRHSYLSKGLCLIPYTCGSSLLLLQLLQNCYYYYYHYYYYCYHCYHTTVLLNTLMQIFSSPGVVELTTQLLIPANIIWLPLCRINKFG